MPYNTYRRILLVSLLPRVDSEVGTQLAQAEKLRLGYMCIECARGDQLQNLDLKQPMYAYKDGGFMGPGSASKDNPARCTQSA